MVWFRVDDCFHCHPKVLEAGNEAAGLWVRCGAYCAQHLTDGVVPRQIVLLYGSAALAEVLVTVGLWISVDDGYQMNDYLLYNRSKAEVMTERSQAAERQRESRERKAAKQQEQRNRNNGHSVSHSVTANDSHTVSHASVTAPVPIPISTNKHSLIVGTPTVSSADADGEFDTFWINYPRKAQKQDARKAWTQQLRKKISPERMIAGAKGYAEYCKAKNTDQQWIKYPGSWLRAGGYDDHQPEPVDTREPVEIIRDLWRAADAQAVAEILRIPYFDRGQPPSDTTPPERWLKESRQDWIASHREAAIEELTRR